jgi:uncharacterized protein (DUF427 family)
MMERMKAIWNGEVIADSDDGVVVEGNYYFPLTSVNRQFLAESTKHTVCPWKGIASYYDVVVNGKTNQAAAWSYPFPKPGASLVRNKVAFWREVRVIPSDQPVESLSTSDDGGLLERVGKLFGR